MTVADAVADAVADGPWESYIGQYLCFSGIYSINISF